MLPDLRLPDPSLRARLAHCVLDSLQSSFPGSTATIRGSLADHTHDAYSDIDIRWEVEDSRFPNALSNVRNLLSEIQPVRSFRIDPDFQNAPGYRLLFVRFDGFPLFWRVDLEILARSRSTGLNPDCNPGISEPHLEWSLSESALANAVAAVKACKRGKPELARELLERAFVRLDLEFAVDSVHDAIMQLVNRARTIEPGTATLALEVQQLVSGDI